MISWIVEASARHRGLVLLGGLALALAGAISMRELRLDAIPDLSDSQVIVFTEWPGRSPTLIEDQITYPVVTSLLGAPDVVEVRGQSMFGMSFIYVIFAEGTDIYWARSRVLELLDTARERLPDGISPRLGPDASGVGWVYQYALLDTSGQSDLGSLRLLHDVSIRYALASVEGVAEVASVGGFVPELQVRVAPEVLREHDLSLTEIASAIRRSSGEVGARAIELSEREHIVRGRGYVTSVEDLESVVLRATPGGTPLTLGQVASVQLGPALRRGAADLDGEGEVVSGIVVMRHGENALQVIERVEDRIRELSASLPPGVRIVPIYDRSSLIERAIETLARALTEEMIVVAAVIFLFLLHFRSALLPIVSLPLAVLTTFIPMAVFGVPATIMSLGGIAIAIGATVDAEIVMIEAAHKKLEHAPPDLSPSERQRLLAEAAQEVTPAIVASLLIVAVSFLPVFGLTGQAGALFRPLALTKTFVMLSAALISITIAPALRDALLRGKIRSEADHPISRAIRAVYEPFVHVALRNPGTTLLIGVFAVLSALPLVPRLGRELMPPLDEGDILFMPTTLPGISIEEARRQLGIQDALLREIPEVDRVLGKVGRAESPTDPAPLSMAETVVTLRPRSEWRTRWERRWYHGWTPEAARPLLTAMWPEFRPLTRAELIDDMSARLRLPGWTNAFTQPIRNRIDMQSTGIRTALGIKVYGRDLAAIERAGVAIERIVRGVPGARSAFYERQEGGAYLDVIPDRAALSRYGLAVADVNDALAQAIGAEVVTTTIDGRARYDVTLRYHESARSAPEDLAEVLIALPGGEHVRLGEVARVASVSGPAMIRDESGMLVGYVYVDLDESRDLGSFVEDARREVEDAVARGAVVLPEGGHLGWTGQYEQLQEMEARMKVLIPLALALVVLLLYLQFRDLTEVLIVLLSVPFSLVGSIWALYLLDFRISTAVLVGVIALIGLAAQTGVVMIVYIDQAYERRMRAGLIRSREDIIAAHAEGTVQRVRPKLMTVGTMLIGLVPLLWAEGSGADVMQRIAAPMVGGLLSSAFLTLELIPVVYTYWRNEQLVLRTIEQAGAGLRAELDRALALARGGALALALSLGARMYVDTERFAAPLAAAHVLGIALLALGAALYTFGRRWALSRAQATGLRETDLGQGETDAS